MRVNETRRRSESVEEAADGVLPDNNDAIFEKASMGAADAADPFYLGDLQSS